MPLTTLNGLLPQGVVARLQVLEVRRDGCLVLANGGEVGEERGEVESGFTRGVVTTSLLTANEAEEVGLRLEEVGVGELDCEGSRWSDEMGRALRALRLTKLVAVIVLEDTLLEVGHLCSTR